MREMSPSFCFMFKIGSVEIKGKVVLAPMAGVTSLAYRKFLKPFGVALSVTEIVSSSGLVYGNDRTIDYIKTDDSEGPIAIQLFDSDPQKIVESMKVVIDSGVKFDFFDINLGCPVPKVTQAGAGSSLLKDSEKLYEFMKVVVENSPKPVTAKIRLGWDEKSINVFDNVKALEKAGVAMIGIHARTAKQLYEGEPNYELIRNLRDSMNVPLVVSGNIFSVEDAINALEITHADAVMVARGSLGNPFLVRQIDHYFKTGEKLPSPSLKENIEYLLEFTDLLIEEKGEERAIRILRGLAPKFLNGYPKMKHYKNLIAQNIVTKKDLVNILQSIDC